MRYFFPLALLLAAAPFARADEQDEIPKYQNPQMEHVTVESAKPKEYLSICPNLCELADGSLLIAYHRIGYVDWAGAQSTWTRVSRDGGKTWSDARLIAENMQAPGLLRLRSGDILLNGCTLVDQRGSTTMRLFRSQDGGQNWAEQKPIWERSDEMQLQGGCASLLELKTGRILCPMFAGKGGTHPRGMLAWCYYSDDNGKTWLQSANKVDVPDHSGVGAEEPSVGELKDGTLVMTLRTGLGHVYVSRSDDGGKAWASPAWSSGLEAPQAPLVMTAFPDGSALLMVYCASKFDLKYEHSGDRTPLRAVVSKDAGKTWRKIGDVAGGPHEFGATSICFTSSGKVVVAYCWHRIPWERKIKTGGVRLAIVDKEWFNKD